jgi:benzoyl-CoA reductase subunit B
MDRMDRDERAAQLVGRGMQNGAELLRGWFADLTASGERKEPAAYVFVMGSLAELLGTFGFHLVFPEIHSLQTAVRRVSAEYLNEAEGLGYSPDICGYVKADVAVQLRGGEHPMGRIPPPSIAVLTNACNTYIKWAEIWERIHDVPIFTLDVPGTRQGGRPEPPGSAGFGRDRRYVLGQLRELIALCEQVSGRRFDVDLLRERLALANQMLAAWREVLELNRARPAPFSGVIEGTVYLGVLNALRATDAGAAYFRDLLEELRFKVENGLGTLAEETYRLAFVGVPCYPIFRRFNELFTGQGGVFVGSTYLWFASGGAGGDFEYDLERPLESLAEGVLLNVRAAMDSMFFPEADLAAMVDRFGLDGLVFHAVKSCRTTSTGLADIRRAVLARCDAPSLLIESDMMDPRVVSEAQLKNRIDAFFEGMASRRRSVAAETAVPATLQPGVGGSR